MVVPIVLEDEQSLRNLTKTLPKIANRSFSRTGVLARTREEAVVTPELSDHGTVETTTAVGMFLPLMVGFHAG